MIFMNNVLESINYLSAFPISPCYWIDVWRAGVGVRSLATGKDRSPRACQRILKVARTLADLEATEVIGQAHLAEAISYRMAGPGHI